MLHKLEVYLASFKVHPHDLYLYRVTNTEVPSTSIPYKRLRPLVKAKKFAAQRADMNKPFAKQAAQFHKQTKTGRRGDYAFLNLADVVNKVLALHVLLHFPRCGIRAAFSHRRTFAQCINFFIRVGVVPEV